MRISQMRLNASDGEQTPQKIKLFSLIAQKHFWNLYLEPLKKKKKIKWIGAVIFY